MMRLPKFRYLAPRSLREVTALLAGEGPEAMVVAGGTDLYPNMKRRHQTPKTLVGLRLIDALRGVSGSAVTGLRIGPATTLSDLEELAVIREHYPGLHEAIHSISTPILRNMGTIGGNVCLDTRCNYYDQNYEWRRAIDFCMKCDGDICWVAPGSDVCLAVSSSDTAPVLCALGARLRLASRKEEAFVCIWLDAQHRAIAFEVPFTGTLTQTSVYPREIVKAALRINAAAVIFAHNHPSGVAQPSQSDELLTRNLKEALSLIEVKVLDHFIVAGNQAISFAERGLL